MKAATESVSQPAGSIRGELSNAVVAGIRWHGAEAVGLILVGLARLFVGGATLGALLVGGLVAGCDITATHFAGATGVAAFINLVFAGRLRPTGSEQPWN